MASTTTNDKQDRLNKALATLKAGGTVPISKSSAARMVDGKIYIYNPQVVQAYEFIGNKQKLAAALKAGKISPISESQLAGALNPTPSVPKPKGSSQPKKKLKGKADDDKGKKKSNVKLRKDADPDLAPGKRLKNPLGMLSSYNYQISLYMITPDALDAFRNNGFKNINSLGVVSAGSLGPDMQNQAVSAGAYIVAQSGGVNSEESRAPSFGFDYGIDNLQFEIVGPKENQTSAAEINFSFVITEPYGFSFISNLKRASLAIEDYANKLKKKREAIAKKKSAAQNQRTSNKGRNGKVNTSARKYTKGGVGGRGTSTPTASEPNQNTKFQSNNDILAGVRGTTSPGKPRPKGGRGGGRAAQDSGYRAATNAFDKEQAAKTSSGKPKGKSSGSSNVAATPQNPTKNFFILGVRFFGYDATGKMVKGTDKMPSTNVTGQVIDGLSQEIDPGNNSYALFERYYPVIITEVKTRVDGRATVYNIKAKPHNLEPLGTKRGIINNKVEITASTVGEAFDKLMARLNKEQAELTGNTFDGYTYDIKYASPYDANRIRNAKIVSKADLDKYKWPGSGAKTTKESNPKQETGKGNKPKNNSRTITFRKGTPIIQAMNQIVAQSSFLEDALRTVYTTAIEPDQDKKDLPALDNSGKKSIEWFHVTPDISNAVWNEDNADWVYDIDYILNVYDTPVIDSAYANPGKKYYGPVKRYEYWYTGTNTEVLKYEQSLNNGFYTTFLTEALGQADKKADQKGGKNTKNAGNGSGNASGVTTSKVQNQKTGQPTQGKAGNAMEAQNSYLTTLFDPSNQAQAKVEILGDPDWMMSAIIPSYGDNERTVYNKFYGSDGYSISNAGGQVFFEIDFKEAVDYKSAGERIATKDGSGISGAPGTMSINNSILFWKDPKSLSKLTKGISYSLLNCKCIFSNGTFKQILTGTINTFGDSGSNDDGKARENNNRTSNSGPNRGNANATTSNKGTKPAPAPAPKSTQPRTIAPFKDQATADAWRGKTYPAGTFNVPPSIAKRGPET